MLSVDEINKLQAENEQLRKVIVETPISTVIAGALWGTIIGQLIIHFIYAFMDALLR